MGIIVSKFGGTSLANYEAMKLSSVKVINHKISDQVVVVSACSGITNKLERLARSYFTSPEAMYQTVQSILTHHLQIAEKIEEQGDDLKGAIVGNVSLLLKMSEKQYHNPSEGLFSSILAIGEYLSAMLFTALLKKEGVESRFIDSRELIHTDNSLCNSNPSPAIIRDKVKENLLPFLGDGIVYVTQGFVGSNHGGQTTTLGRGGSDFSAALLAEAVAADSLYIWTDVDGFYTSDPKSDSTAERYGYLSYGDARKLSIAGAKIVHQKTISPVERAGIPLFVAHSHIEPSPYTFIGDCETKLAKSSYPA